MTSRAGWNGFARQIRPTGHSSETPDLIYRQDQEDFGVILLHFLVDFS